MVIETGPSEEKRVISGLKPYSQYTLSVTVYNSKGEGPHSEPVPFSTEEGGEKREGPVLVVVVVCTVCVGLWVVFVSVE